MESPFLSILVLIAAVLLVGVTSGVIYLTLADWRDAFGVRGVSRKESSYRRRREDETRELKRSTAKRR